MTYLIVGSVLLILASATALVFGWIDSNESLIWLSVASSVGAAVCLALAYHRSRSAPPSPPRGE
jgi:hypothetical protein